MSASADTASAKKPCGGCKQPIVLDSDALNCSSCKIVYHISCILPGHDETSDLASYRSSWLCPSCKPRTSTRDNTPIRASSTGQKNNEDANVTRRKKPGNTPVGTPAKTNVELTSETVREIVKEEMKGLLKQLNDTMANFVTRELKPIKDDIASLKDSMDFISGQYEDIKSDITTKFGTVDKLLKENEELKSTVKDLNSRINFMEQQARSCNVEIQCLPEFRSENLMSTVVNMGRVLSCNIAESSIHNVTRIAKQNPENTRPKSIIVQFNSPRTRDEFLAASIKYNKDHHDDKLNSAALGLGGDKQSVYIVEHLSAYYKALHAAARKKARELDYKYVWVRNGRIFMRKSDGSEYKFIRDYDTLARLE